MRIGIPKERKDNERRVGITPEGVATLVGAGHEVIIETDAGLGSGISNEEFTAAGATLGSEAECWAQEIVIKVKEPIPSEYQFLRKDLTLFCYLHLAAEPELTQALLDSGCTAIAFETVTSPRGGLPLLTPMSEIAGRLSVQVGAHLLTSPQGGPGVLLGGIAGVAPINVVVVGGGVAGAQAVDVAVGMGAHVTVIDINTDTLRGFMARYNGRVACVQSSPAAIAQALSTAHLVVGAVLVPGAKAPKVITNEHLALLPRGAVVVDIAIDQGGCTEASAPTSHSDPTFPAGKDGGVTMYCVTNMPGAASQTATRALAAQTLPLLLQMANAGVDEALASNPHLAAGLNVADGTIVCPAVAQAFA